MLKYENLVLGYNALMRLHKGVETPLAAAIRKHLETMQRNAA